MTICGIFKLIRKRRGSKGGATSGEDVEGEDTPNQGGINTIDTTTMETEVGRCDFSGTSFVCVSMITWNMNGRVSSQDLEQLVEKTTESDLVVIGLQEAPYRNTSKLLQSALSSTHLLLGKSVMQSLQLYVFGPLYSGLFTKELKVDKHSTGGCGGLMRRKKGAVAIRFTYKGISMLFIACHLSAHVDNVDKRNSQLIRISETLFSTKHNPYSRPPQLIVWLGDLNYRLQGIDSYPARDLIHSNHQNELAGKDQLLQEAERGSIFQGYNEGMLTFNPTYKYDIGSSSYDTSHKVRAPAWTDRILFKNQDPDNIRTALHCYDSMDGIHCSDHKPVKAHLCLKSANNIV